MDRSYLNQENMKEKLKIEYLNSKKNLQMDCIEFEGTDAYEQDIKWVRDNLENFHVDMIQVVYLNQNAPLDNY